VVGSWQIAGNAEPDDVGAEGGIMIMDGRIWRKKGKGEKGVKGGAAVNMGLMIPHPPGLVERAPP